MSKQANQNVYQRPAPKKSAAQSPLLWVALLVVLAGAAVAAITLLGGDDDGGVSINSSDGESTDTTGAETDEAAPADNEAAQTAGPAILETGAVQISGTPLPAYETPDAAVGMQAPAFSAQTFQGDTLQFGGDGTPRVYAFLAHWCPHCQAELPVVSAWLKTDPLPAGVEVVAVATGTREGEDNYPPSAWFADSGWSATVVADSAEGEIAAAFGLTAFPFWVVVDADGNVVQRATGTVGTDQLDTVVAAIAPAGS